MHDVQGRSFGRRSRVGSARPLPDQFQGRIAQPHILSELHRGCLEADGGALQPLTLPLWMSGRIRRTVFRAISTWRVGVASESDLDLAGIPGVAAAAGL